ITLNMGAGDSAPKLEASTKAMAAIVQGRVVQTATRRRTTFNVPKNRKIGVKVTLRGERAASLLKRLVAANEGKIKARAFDRQGNFSFGVKEYIHIPGVSYNPEVGILGLDVCVTLEKPGFRVRKRRIRQRPVGRRQLISPAEAKAWAKAFGFTVQEADE
ncbi:MAG: 50S ribosomal protein L5, partial [Candidatus Aenigmarchaeota archaeon]|nr:50S ribosomal protein L5 [Candidatus Aenigmarchaeota archaeon]